MVERDRVSEVRAESPGWERDTRDTESRRVVSRVSERKRGSTHGLRRRRGLFDSVLGDHEGRGRGGCRATACGAGQLAELDVRTLDHHLCQNGSAYDGRSTSDSVPVMTCRCCRSRYGAPGGRLVPSALSRSSFIRPTRDHDQRERIGWIKSTRQGCIETRLMLSGIGRRHLLPSHAFLDSTQAAVELVHFQDASATTFPQKATSFPPSRVAPCIIRRLGSLALIA